jgi:hypothetical protein
MHCLEPGLVTNLANGFPWEILTEAALLVAASSLALAKAASALVRPSDLRAAPLLFQARAFLGSSLMDSSKQLIAS